MAGEIQREVAGQLIEVKWFKTKHMLRTMRRQERARAINQVGLIRWNKVKKTSMKNSVTMTVGEVMEKLVANKSNSDELEVTAYYTVNAYAKQSQCKWGGGRNHWRGLFCNGYCEC